MRTATNSTCLVVATSIVAILAIAVETRASTPSIPVRVGSVSGGPPFVAGWPSVATDGAGNWVAVWDGADFTTATGPDRDIFVSRSTDNGATWSNRVALSANATTDVGDDEAPTIATDGLGNWVVVWHSDDDLGGTIGSDHDILVSRSADAGATWTPPAPLGTNAASDAGDDFEPIVARAPSGTWLATWTSWNDLAGALAGDSDIYVSRSIDDGATWTLAQHVDTNATSDAVDDYAPAIATSVSGTALIAWSSDDGAFGPIDSDILVVRSTDDGLTWTSPAPLNSDAAVDTDGDGGVVIASDGGTGWIAAWGKRDTRGAVQFGADLDLAVARSTDDGATWSAYAWLNSTADADFGHAADDRDVSLTHSAGTWVAVWRAEPSIDGPPPGIYAATSLDVGTTWSPPTPMISEASTELFAATNPVVASDGSGRWIVAAVGGGRAVSFDSSIVAFRWTEPAWSLCAPTAICAPADQTVLSLRRRPTDPSANRLKWRWSKGMPLDIAGLGDPTQTTDYALCFGDDVGTPVEIFVPAGQLWSDVSAKGYRYSDSAGSNAGIQRVGALASGGSKSKISASGAALPGIALPASGNVLIELHNLANGYCFGVTIPASALRENDAVRGRLKAKY